MEEEEEEEEEEEVVERREQITLTSIIIPPTHTHTHTHTHAKNNEIHPSFPMLQFSPFFSGVTEVERRNKVTGGSQVDN